MLMGKPGMNGDSVRHFFNTIRAAEIDCTCTGCLKVDGKTQYAITDDQPPYGLTFRFKPSSDGGGSSGGGSGLIGDSTGTDSASVMSSSSSLGGGRGQDGGSS